MQKLLVGLTILFVSIYCISCSMEVETNKEKADINNKFNYKEVPIAGNAYLRFYKFEDSINLYFEPKMVINSQKFPIKNFDTKNGSTGEIKAVSPDGNYFVLDVISNNQKNRPSTCLIIDVPNKIVVRQLENHCDGEWNKANQWIVNDQIIVSFD